MVKLPKLRERPVGIQACTNFAGLDRRPGASSGTRNKTWRMSWRDERNLSSDRAPRISVRKARGRVFNIDGNQPGPIAAMSGGDKIALLDDQAVLWCGGNSLDLYKDGDGPLPDRETAWSTMYADDRATISPETGADASNTALGGLTNPEDWYRDYLDVVFRVEAVDSSGVPTAWKWYAFGGDTWDWTNVDPATYGITLNQKAPLTVGWTFQIELRRRLLNTEKTQLIRMGADLLVVVNGIITVWADAVRLASGQSMTWGSDYGLVYGYAMLGENKTLTLTLCDVDGEPYNGVVVSSTEPAQQGYWLNTSGQTPELMEWSVSTTSWIHITGTYVKIRSDYLALVADYDNIKKGDTCYLQFDCPSGTNADVVELLNSQHYIYDADEFDEWVIVAGILPSDTVTVTCEEGGSITRPQPQFDFITEAQNRLWACRYSEEDSINEIYGSKLGDFRNWHVFQGLSTDSWTASRGTAAPYTGAITLGGNPLFFREESLEKVIPSSSGAHQILTYSLEGVQHGSSGSMVIIDEHLFYKSRMGVCVYTGSLPTRISDGFDDWQFSAATAARHRDKYCCCMTRSDEERLCMVYDTETGDWHPEDECWDGIAVTWKDQLYYVREGQIYQMDGKSDSQGVPWFAETDELAVELPEHKWVTYVRIRLQLELGATCRVYFSYDDGPWQRKAGLSGNTLHTVETAIWPRRCDHFRFRIEGTGGCEIQSISYRVERSQGGH